MVEYIIEKNEVDVFGNIVQDINTFISENLGKHYFIFLLDINLFEKIEKMILKIIVKNIKV